MPGPFTFTFEPSVTSQQKTWFNDALARTRFAINRGGVAITVRTVDEPSVPGHNDYMASITDASHMAAVIEIRTGADDPTSSFVQGLRDPAKDIKHFFQESVIHELGHVFWNTYYPQPDDIAALAGMFRRATQGQTATVGTPDEWDPADAKWGDRIMEGLAEFFKDIYLPSTERVYDNRSNWNFDQPRLNEWFDMIEAIICRGDTGGGGGIGS